MKKRKWYPWFLSSIAIYLMLSLILPLIKGQSPIRFGLDISGGVVVSYKPDFTTTLEKYKQISKQEILKSCKDILTDRLNRKLHITPDIYIRSDERIIVSIPNVQNYNQVLEIVGQTYKLTLRIIVNEYFEEIPGLKLFEYYNTYYELGEAQFSGDMLDPKSIRVQSGDPQAFKSEDRAPRVAFAFNSPYDKAFEKFTRENKGKKLAILLDDQIEVIATIQSAISKGGVLTGNYTYEEANDNAILLISGTLPVSLKMESLSGVGPSLGQKVKELGLTAALLSILLLLFLIFIAYLHRSWFLFSGMIILFVLLFSIAGMVSAFDLTLDFAGIAGLILAVGMGMDAFIIIFESLEDKLKDLPSSAIAKHLNIIVGEIYSFASEGRVLFHANMTTLLAIIMCLYIDRVKFFALFIIVGIFASFYTILITRELLRYTYNLAPNFGPSLIGWLRGKQPGIFRLYKPYLAFSVIVFLFAIFLLQQSSSGKKYLQLGSDFKPGTQIICKTEKFNNIDNAISEITSNIPEANLKVQKLLSKGQVSTTRYLLNLDIPLLSMNISSDSPNLTQRNEDERMTSEDLVDFGSMPESSIFGENRELNNSEFSFSSTSDQQVHLTPNFLVSVLNKHDIDLLSVTSIDSKVSSKRFSSSLSALFFSFGLLAFYLIVIQNFLNKTFFSKNIDVQLGIRNPVWVSVGVLLALVHDISIILILCFFLKIKISLTVIAAILTIIGYSVNDSVVVWSHIEKKAIKYKAKEINPFQLTKSCIDSILIRAALTSVSTIIPALAILVIGIDPLKDFALVITVGTIAGTFSSIFVVGFFALKTLEPKRVIVKTSTIKSKIEDTTSLDEILTKMRE